MVPLNLRAGLLALVLLSTPAAGQQAARRVLRAADIAAGGWHRLGDVVASLMPGSVATVDGFNAMLTSGRIPFAGLSAPGSPQWTVRLDGQRIPVAVDGMWILDQLPVAMTQVDSVVVFTGSSIVDGHASLLGTIDVYTRRPSPGLSGIGDYQHGDESGDPGPYRYTPRATPNVEKLGPFTSGALAYAHGGWSLDGEARYSSLNITDTSISRRFSNFGALQSDVNSSGGSGVLTTSLMGGTQYTVGGRGRFTGLLWVPSAKLDSQVRVVTTQGGSSGDFLFGKTRVRYGATALSLARSRIGPSPLGAVIGETRGFDDLFAEASLPSAPVAIGVGQSWVWSSPVPNTKSIKQVTSQRLWVDLLGSSTSHGVTISAERQGSAVAPSASGWIATRLSSRYELTTTVSSIQRIAAADGAGFDQKFGPQFVVDTTPFGVFNPDVTPRNTRFSEVRVEVADQSRATLTPSVDARFVYTSNWQLNPDIAFGAGPIQFLIIGAGIETKPSARLTASVRGEATAYDAADSTTLSAMHSTPAASLRADISTVVMTNYRLSASGRLTTSTKWPSESIFDETDGLPALRRIDVSANKPFWHDRIRAQLVIRNLLAQDERYHPVGASWNFRTHLAITVALPPYSSAMTKP